MILLADGEGPDQAAQMYRLICIFAVHICPKTRFWWYLSYFSQKIGFDISMETICMNVKDFFSGKNRKKKNKKKNFKELSAEFFKPVG